jgi:hypothetical protein
VTPGNLLAHLRFQYYRHGWSAAAGLALIAGAIGFQYFGVAEQRAQATELRVKQSALRQRLAQRPIQEETANKRYADFFASLPAANGALEAITVIHRSAGANGIKMANGEYRLVREGNTQWQRYQITLPAHSSYPRLRAWLAELMNAVPALALDEISFQRDDVGSDSVEARLRMTLFLRGP